MLGLEIYFFLIKCYTVLMQDINKYDYDHRSKWLSEDQLNFFS